MGVGDDPVAPDREAAAMAEADHLVLLAERDHDDPHHRAPGDRNIVGARGRGRRDERQHGQHEEDKSAHLFSLALLWGSGREWQAEPV